MKSLLTILFFSFCVNGYTQIIDSAFISDRYKQYLADTGTYLPETNLVDRKDNPVSLDRFKGKILYIGLWATSCGASIAKFPYQEQLLKRLKEIQADSFIQFINIHVEDPKQDWHRALKKYDPIGINLYCSDTSILSKWNLEAPPAYILLNQAGKVLAKNIHQPDEAGGIDFILYCAINGIHPADAIVKEYEQAKLMEKHKTAAAITDPGYAEWFSKTIRSFIEFQSWRTEHMKKNNR